MNGVKPEICKAFVSKKVSCSPAISASANQERKKPDLTFVDSPVQFQDLTIILSVSDWPDRWMNELKKYGDYEKTVTNASCKKISRKYAMREELQNY